MAINDPDSNAAQLMAAFNKMNENIGNLNGTLMSLMNENKKNTATSQTELRQQALQIKQESAYFSDVIEQNKILNASLNNFGSNTINYLKNINKNDKNTLSYYERSKIREDMRDIQNKTKTRKDGVFTRFLSQTMTEINNNIRDIYRQLSRDIDRRTEEKKELTSKGYNARQVNEIKTEINTILKGYKGLDLSKVNVEEINSVVTKSIFGSGLNLRDITAETKATLIELAAMQENVSDKTAATLQSLQNQGVDILKDVVNRTKSLRKLGYTGDVNEIFTGIDQKEIAKTANLFGISAQKAMQLELERNTIKYMSKGIYGNEQVGNFIDSLAMAAREDYSGIGGSQNYTAALSLLGMDYKGMQKLLSSEGGYAKLQQMLTNKIKELQVNGDQRAASELARALGMDLDSFYQIRVNEKAGSLQQRHAELQEEMRREHGLQDFIGEKIVAPLDRLVNLIESTSIFNKLANLISDTGLKLDGPIVSSLTAIAGAVFGQQILKNTIESILKPVITFFSKFVKIEDVAAASAKKAGSGVKGAASGAELASEGMLKGSVGMGKHFGKASKAGSFLGKGGRLVGKIIAPAIEGGMAISDFSEGNYIGGSSHLLAGGTYFSPAMPIAATFDIASAIEGLFREDEKNRMIPSTAEIYEMIERGIIKPKEDIKATGFYGLPEENSFKSGLNNVPYDEFPAYLHKGEMVLTKEEATAYRNFMDRIKYFENGLNIDGSSRKDTVEEKENIITFNESEVGVIVGNKGKRSINDIINGNILGIINNAFEQYKDFDPRLAEINKRAEDYIMYLFDHDNANIDNNYLKYLENNLNNLEKQLVKEGKIPLNEGQLLLNTVNEKWGLPLYYNEWLNNNDKEIIKNSSPIKNKWSLEKAIKASKNKSLNRNKLIKTKENTPDDPKYLFEMMQEKGTGGAHYSASDMDLFVDNIRGGWNLSIQDYMELLNNKYNLMQKEKKAATKIRKIDGNSVGKVIGSSTYNIKSKYLIGEFTNILDKIASNSDIINKLKEDKLGITLISAYRNAQQTKELVEAGVGVNNSLHRAGLAIDYNLMEGDGKLIEVGDKKGLSDEVKNKYNEYSTLIQGLNGNFYGGHNFTNSWDGNHIQLRKSAFLANRAKYMEEVLKKQRDLNEKATKTDEEVEILKEQLKCLQNIYTNNKEESDRNKPKPVITKPGPRAVLNHNNRTR